MLHIIKSTELITVEGTLVVTIGVHYRCTLSSLLLLGLLMGPKNFPRFSLPKPKIITPKTSPEIQVQARTKIRSTFVILCNVT